MSEINYFQHYSQSENHTTNNTALILRHFYRESTRKLEEVLSSLDVPLDIGPVFRQQIRSSQSVPDALISQQSFNIFFEVKGGGQGIRDNQIENHIRSIKNDDKLTSQKILFTLTREPIPTDQADRLSDLAKGEGIIFKAITFSELLEALKQFCAPHETELQDILDDYERYIESVGLLPPGEFMHAVSVGISIKENIKFRLYYDPIYDNRFKLRPSSKFIGLYANKCVSYVGRLNAVVAGDLDEKGEFEVQKVEFPASDYKPTAEELQRITDAINVCSSYFPSVGEGHRFHLFSEFEETKFHKESKYGIRRSKSFNLPSLFGENKNKEYETAEVAEKLRGCKF